MFETATRELEPPATTEASHLTCTTCGERIVAIETRGPGRHVAVPCGHRISPTTRECVAGDVQRPEEREKSLVTDGGHTEIEACPDCDSAQIYQSTGDPRGTHTPEATYRCNDCGSHFETPERRQPKVDVDNRRGLAGRLLDADPDELGGDRLVTDGGRPATWTDLNAFQRDVLEATRRLENDDETPYGLSIKRELERMYGGEEINHGRLYPNLDSLVEEDFIEKGQLDRRTNSYELTEKARQMLCGRVHRLADACDMDQPVADGGEQT